MNLSFALEDLAFGRRATPSTVINLVFQSGSHRRLGDKPRFCRRLELSEPLSHLGKIPRFWPASNPLNRDRPRF